MGRVVSRWHVAIVAVLACVTGGVLVQSGVLGAQAQQAAPSAFVPIDSYRTFDSRVAPWSAKLPTGSIQPVHPSFNLAQEEPMLFPEGTVAVAYNATVTETEGAGYLEIDALPMVEATSSNVNWTGSGQTLANSGITRVQIGDDGSLVFGIRAGGAANARAHVVVDITGYFVEV